MYRLTHIAGLLCLAGLLLSGTASWAGEKKLMHCFAFSPIETATDADWQAFFKATDAIPEKIPVVSKVWYGKLRGNGLAIMTTNRETSKKLAAGEKDVTAPVNRVVRRWGVCMEMADEAALKTYADHTYHAEWVAAYGKVRVPGTTTFDILGQ